MLFRSFNVVEIGDKMVVDFSEVYALNQNGYAFVSDTLDIPISPLTLTVTGVSVEDKVYDGTAAAKVSGEPKIEGVCKDDDVTLKGTLTAEFENAEVGKNKKIVLSGLTLEGDSALLANYKLALPELKAEISKKTESIGARAVAQNKALDRDAKIRFDGQPSDKRLTIPYQLWQENANQRKLAKRRRPVRLLPLKSDRLNRFRVAWHRKSQSGSSL